MSFSTLEELGQRIASLRERRDLSRADVASQIGMEESDLAAVEAGERGLAVAELDAIAATLDVPADALISADDAAAPLFRNEGGEAASVAACAEFTAVMDDFFTFAAAVRR